MLLNFLAFQAGWLACVVGAARGWPWLGPMLCLVIVAWHLSNARNKQAALFLLLQVGLVGFLFDQALLSMEWVAYPAMQWPAGLLPPWMMALWLLFATTLNLSLHWLKRKPFLAFFFGLIGGPLAYWAGARLGAIIWQDFWHLLLALGLGWGLVMPMLMWLAQRHDGVDASLLPRAA